MKRVIRVIMILGIIALASSTVPTQVQGNDPEYITDLTEQQKRLIEIVSKVNIGTELRFKNELGDVVNTIEVTEEMKFQMLQSLASQTKVMASCNYGMDCFPLQCFWGTAYCCCQYWDEAYGQWYTYCEPRGIC